MRAAWYAPSAPRPPTPAVAPPQDAKVATAGAGDVPEAHLRRPLPGGVEKGALSSAWAPGLALQQVSDTLLGAPTLPPCSTWLLVSEAGLLDALPGSGRSPLPEEGDRWPLLLLPLELFPPLPDGLTAAQLTWTPLLQVWSPLQQSFPRACCWGAPPPPPFSGPWQPPGASAGQSSGLAWTGFCGMGEAGPESSSARKAGLGAGECQGPGLGIGVPLGVLCFMALGIGPGLGCAQPPSCLPAFPCILHV